jgi:phosphoribosylformylglycinamidine synthase
VLLKVEAKDNAFTRHYPQGTLIRIPVAHHDGNFTAEPETLDRLEGEGRVAFRYVDEAGEASAAANPNGAARSIAGILSENRRVLGLMPHPERLVEPAQGGTDGRAFFTGLVEALS